MKYSLVFIFTIFFLSNVYSQDLHLRRYNVESAIIEYEISGTSTGVEKIIFDNWGLREVKYSYYKTENNGEKKDYEYETFLLGDTTISIDLTKNTGVMMPSTISKDYSKAIDSISSAEAFRILITKMGGKYIGNEQFFDRDCSVWEIPQAGLKFQTWQNITLKTETNFLGIKTTTQVTNININPQIPKGTFLLPKGITLKAFESNVK
jgi:hypothetical protein